MAGQDNTPQNTPPPSKPMVVSQRRKLQIFTRTTAAAGSKLIQLKPSKTGVSVQKTRHTLGHMHQMVHEATSWKPDIGALKPDMVQRFAGNIKSHIASFKVAGQFNRKNKPVQWGETLNMVLPTPSTPAQAQQTSAPNTLSVGQKIQPLSQSERQAVASRFPQASTSTTPAPNRPPQTPKIAPRSRLYARVEEVSPNKMETHEDEDEQQSAPKARAPDIPAVTPPIQRLEAPSTPPAPKVEPQPARPKKPELDISFPHPASPPAHPSPTRLPLRTIRRESSEIPAHPPAQTPPPARPISGKLQRQPETPVIPPPIQPETELPLPAPIRAPQPARETVQPGSPQRHIPLRQPKNRLAAKRQRPSLRKTAFRTLRRRPQPVPHRLVTSKPPQPTLPARPVSASPTEPIIRRSFEQTTPPLPVLGSPETRQNQEAQPPALTLHQPPSAPQLEPRPIPTHPLPEAAQVQRAAEPLRLPTAPSIPTPQPPSPQVPVPQVPASQSKKIQPPIPSDKLSPTPAPESQNSAPKIQIPAPSQPEARPIPARPLPTTDQVQRAEAPVQASSLPLHQPASPVQPEERPTTPASTFQPEQRPVQPRPISGLEQVQRAAPRAQASAEPDQKTAPSHTQSEIHPIPSRPLSKPEQTEQAVVPVQLPSAPIERSTAAPTQPGPRPIPARPISKPEPVQRAALPAQPPVTPVEQAHPHSQPGPHTLPNHPLPEEKRVQRTAAPAPKPSLPLRKPARPVQPESGPLPAHLVQFKARSVPAHPQPETDQVQRVAQPTLKPAALPPQPENNQPQTTAESKPASETSAPTFSTPSKPGQVQRQEAPTPAKPTVIQPKENSPQTEPGSIPTRFIPARPLPIVDPIQRAPSSDLPLHQPTNTPQTEARPIPTHPLPEVAQVQRTDAPLPATPPHPSAPSPATPSLRSSTPPPATPPLRSSPASSPEPTPPAHNQAPKESPVIPLHPAGPEISRLENPVPLQATIKDQPISQPIPGKIAAHPLDFQSQEEVDLPLSRPLSSPAAQAPKVSSSPQPSQAPHEVQRLEQKQPAPEREDQPRPLPAPTLPSPLPETPVSPQVLPLRRPQSKPLMARLPEKVVRRLPRQTFLQPKIKPAGLRHPSVQSRPVFPKPEAGRPASVPVISPKVQTIRPIQGRVLSSPPPAISGPERQAFMPGALSEAPIPPQPLIPIRPITAKEADVPHLPSDTPPTRPGLVQRVPDSPHTPSPQPESPVRRPTQLPLRRVSRPASDQTTPPSISKQETSLPRIPNAPGRSQVETNSTPRLLQKPPVQPGSPQPTSPKKPMLAPRPQPARQIARQAAQLPDQPKNNRPVRAFHPISRPVHKTSSVARLPQKQNWLVASASHSFLPANFAQPQAALSLHAVPAAPVLEKAPATSNPAPEVQHTPARPVLRRRQRTNAPLLKPGRTRPAPKVRRLAQRQVTASHRSSQPLVLRETPLRPAASPVPQAPVVPAPQPQTLRRQPTSLSNRTQKKYNVQPGSAPILQRAALPLAAPSRPAQTAPASVKMPSFAQTPSPQPKQHDKSLGIQRLPVPVHPHQTEPLEMPLRPTLSAPSPSAPAQIQRSQSEPPPPQTAASQIITQALQEKQKPAQKSPLELQELAEQLLPIVKRLLAIEFERESGRRIR